MSEPRVNPWGQPVGEPVDGWHGAPVPSRETLEGRYARLEPLHAPAHAAQMAPSFVGTDHAAIWTYLPFGPFETEADFAAWIRKREESQDAVPYAIIDLHSMEALGTASYARIEAVHGSVEIAAVVFGERLQRTRAATEAIYLLLRHCFSLGYRRCEWKADVLNAPSRRAAERYGFTQEGIFRQAMVVRGLNRDIIWYSMLDREWPARRAALEAWLAPDNFDASGRQAVSLSSLMHQAGGSAAP